MSAGEFIVVFVLGGAYGFLFGHPVARVAEQLWRDITNGDKWK